jgi:hypothetical protein
LGCPCCCDRIKAAENLGSRLHADFCCTPEVLSALTGALANDPCWEVRRAAAWSIAHQKARTEEGVLALYLASKLDPHYLVRDAANDALGILLVCRRECFKDVFAHGDEMVKALRGHYKPGQATATMAPPEALKQPPAEKAPPKSEEVRGEVVPQANLRLR